MIKLILLLTFLNVDINMENNSLQKDSLVKKYYASWGTYQMPRKPLEELSPESIKNREAAYYIGYYNKNKQLVIFEKFYHNKMEWRDEYYYWEGKNKLQKLVQTDTEGKKTEKQFDKKGKEVK